MRGDEPYRYLQIYYMRQYDWIDWLQQCEIENIDWGPMSSIFVVSENGIRSSVIEKGFRRGESVRKEEEDR